MENLEKRITVGQEKFDKLCANYKEITMLKKNLTKQNVQALLAVGPREKFQKLINVGPLIRP